MDDPSLIEEADRQYRDHDNFDANAFEILVILEEVIFAKEYVKPPKSDEKVDNSNDKKY